jgi:hypothetical protein
VPLNARTLIRKIACDGHNIDALMELIASTN